MTAWDCGRTSRHKPWQAMRKLMPKRFQMGWKWKGRTLPHSPLYITFSDTIRLTFKILHMQPKSQCYTCTLTLHNDPNTLTQSPYPKTSGSCFVFFSLDGFYLTHFLYVFGWTWTHIVQQDSLQVPAKLLPWPPKWWDRSKPPPHTEN